MFALLLLMLLLLGLALIVGALRLGHVAKLLLWMVAIVYAYCIIRAILICYFGETTPWTVLALASVAAYLYRERHRLGQRPIRPSLGSLERERLDIAHSPLGVGLTDQTNNELEGS
jgi:hypothetical protein